MSEKLSEKLKRHDEKWEYEHYEPDSSPDGFMRLLTSSQNEDGSIDIESIGCGCCGHTHYFTPKEYLALLKRATKGLIEFTAKMEVQYKENGTINFE